MLAWAAEEYRRQHGVVWLGRCSPDVSPPFSPIMTALGDRWPGVAFAESVDSADSLHVASSFDQPELNQVRALADLVANEAAAHPVLLALDDIHWADPSTLGVIEQLIYVLAAGSATSCRVLLLLTHRPVVDESHARGVLSRVAREPSFRSLPLDALNEGEINELARRLTAKSLDRRVVQRVHEASAGNPLVAIAAIDAASSPASSHPRLDRTVDDVMARYVDDLTPLGIRVALALALHTQPVHVDHLAALCGLPEDATARTIDALDRARLVTLADDHCELVSPHVAEAVLAAATSKERQVVHARAAVFVRSSTDAEVDLLTLAHHLERAGPRYAAELGQVAYGAAECAFATGAWGWAARLYETAIDNIAVVIGSDGSRCPRGEGRHRLLPRLRPVAL